MTERSRGNAADLQGITKLITDATLEITDLVQAVQRQIVNTPQIPETPIQPIINGIYSISFRTVTIATRLIGGGINKTLGLVNSWLGESHSSDEKEAVIAALNGVMGDYLENSQNPLSIKMQWRYNGKTIRPGSKNIERAYPKITGRLLLLVHGLCMNDIQWNSEGYDHGEKIATSLNLTPVYLHYNGGCHISTNGQRLNEAIRQLVSDWPVPIEELVIVAHSMGGLVSRSAVHYGLKNNQSWTSYLKKIVFLGTPHHGTRLERAGNFVDSILKKIPYARLYGRLTKIRSAGITDLRHGSIADEDWQGMDRFESGKDDRIHVPLPSRIECYTIAASTNTDKVGWRDRLIGDGLVDLASALGKHKNPDRDLQFEASKIWILHNSNHMDLLRNPAVTDQIKYWLSEEC